MLISGTAQNIVKMIGKMSDKEFYSVQVYYAANEKSKEKLSLL